MSSRLVVLTPSRRRRLTAGVTWATAIVVAASLLQGVESPARAESHEAPTVQRQKKPAPDRPAAPIPPRESNPVVQAALRTAPEVKWPEAGTVEVPVTPVTGSTGAAGRSAGTAPPAKVRVQTLDRSVSTRARVDGPVTRIGRAAGETGSGTVRLPLSYAGIADAYGGDFGARLRLVRLPECALTTPDAPTCAPEPVPAVNNAGADTLTATVEVGAGTELFAMVASESSAQGSYGATEFAPSSKWNVSPSSGAFNWSYPMRVPPVPGGLAPSVVLGYNSQSTDGRTATTNNQGSWLGEGFSYEPGYVERRYNTCLDDGHDAMGDLCWAHDNAVLMLNGRSSVLVRTGGTWRFANDDGSKIERFSGPVDGAVNGDNDREFWKVTTVDGTEHYFGLNRLPGWASGNPETASVWTVPVFGDDVDEPCYNATLANAWCQQGWRWNLDYVKDRHGNVTSYFYERETNHYALRARTNVDGTEYHRGGWLKRIDYGQRHNAVYSTPAAARVVFTDAERCLPSGSVTCAPSQLNNNTANSWPDVPWDRNCAAETHCAIGQSSPSFWTRKRVTQITTEIRSGSDWTPVDSWNLTHLFTNNADGSRSLWLHKIDHQGRYGGGDPLTVPSVELGPLQLPNRIDIPGDNITGLIRPRLTTVYTDSGGQVDVTYKAPDCSASSLPTEGNSTRRCYPLKWSPSGEANPVTDWFHKYVVESVSESDRTNVEPGTALAPDMVTSYEYLGDAAWRHADPDGIGETKYLTWNQWRGYEKVRVRRGNGQTTTTLTEHTYLRGMHGDKRPGGGTPPVTRTDSVGTSYTDHDELAGFEIETAVYNGSQVSSKSLTSPWRYETASYSRTWGTERAFFVKPRVSRGFTALEGGGWRETKSVTTYDPATTGYTDPVGRVTQVEDLGDVSTPADDRCTRTTYADNQSLRLRTLVAREETVSVACSVANPDRATQLLVDNRTSYDGQAYGATPTRGNASRIEKLGTHNGAAASYVTVGEGTFDAYGRPLTAQDGSGAVTNIAYTETNGLTTRKTETGPQIRVGTADTRFVATTDYHPAWGVPVTQTDWNGKRTDIDYDKLGRAVRVWLPDRPKASTPGQPSVRYTYKNQDNAPVSVKTERRDNAGNWVPEFTIYDGFLRPRQIQVPGPDGGRLVSETFYNATGQVAKLNDKFYAAGAAADTLLKTVNGDVDLQTVYVYDGVDRVTNTITQVAGQEKWRTVTSYGGDRVHVDPPAGGTPTTTITDARGQVREFRQYHGGEPSGAHDSTTYTYTPAGQQASVTDPAGNFWTYAYDQRGRKVEAVDPDSGTSTFTYNDYDQLTSTTDGRGVTLSHTYDVLGRKTGTYQGSVATGTKIAEWGYDTVAKGQLYFATRIVDGGHKYHTIYVARDAFYRVQRVHYSIPAADTHPELAGSYQFNTQYNSDGTVRSSGFPASGGLPGESIAYTYDDLQRVTQITGHQTYLSRAEYAQTGELLQAESSAGSRKVYGTYFYEEGTNRLARSMLSRQAFAGENPMVPTSDIDQRYRYDDAGNLLSIADTPGSGTRDIQCFQYDYLRRMTRAWSTGNTATDPCAGGPGTSGVGGPAPYHHSYGYDLAGNRLSETIHAAGGASEVERTYSYPQPGQAQPHTLSQVVEETSAGDRLYSYEYDDAGNTTKRVRVGEEQDLVWNAEGRLASVTEGGQTTSYVYDADGARLVRKDPDAITVYLPNMELKLNRSNSVVDGTRYYPVGGQLAVVRTVMGVQVQAADHHGTGQAGVNGSTGQVTHRRMAPFGTPRGSQPGVGQWLGEKGFVGGTQDASTGLTSLGAREYDPQTGRFISVDPIIDVNDPQQMHGYAYANNSPMSFTDPDGLRPLATGGGAEEDKYWEDRGEKLTQGSDGKWKVGSNGKKRPSEPPEVTRARQAVEHAKQTVIAVAKELGQILMDELGITDAVDCFIDGDMGACAATALNVVMTAVGGAVGKLVGRYAFKLDKLKDLGERLWNLGGRLKDSVAKWMNGRRVLDRAQSAAPDCNSFVPGTLVLLADGSTKRIEELDVGDLVVAADPESGETAAKPVVATIIGHGQKNLVEITVDTDGDRGEAEGVLIATDGHPFWVPEVGEWLDAGELSPGQWLQTSAGTWVQITAVREWTETRTVHNLTIDDIHTYHVLAGNTPVLVHNCGGTVWDDIKGTQPEVPGTGGMPKSFEMAAGDTKVWVHGNASKHIAEYAENMTSRGASPEMVRLGTQQNLRSLQAAVGKAGRGGLAYDKLLNVGGWELKFGAPRQAGMLPALVHARMVG
ncbi:polymorphic toxin-type HINT domain-containing protein [Solwaraspora sp. WMMD1047]|uniref:polymorphic toxin-type HINT domain-containing protein n=1 Tax=Solwaraspora sp. WMMD1047 TaxID=3016102 RepID=UPI00241761BF|nr:polymorphic toxin-type HINT domain-containing protein [Solwaraspora sp. WMMD1047]MDG4832662.1 polymorphic toxin-type HINT domain-containing protein [Solwaraspora sp. WMMD1047]